MFRIFIWVFSNKFNFFSFMCIHRRSQAQFSLENSTVPLLSMSSMKSTIILKLLFQIIDLDQLLLTCWKTFPLYTVLAAELPWATCLHSPHFCTSDNMYAQRRIEGPFCIEIASHFSWPSSPTKDGTWICVPETKKEKRDREWLEGGER